MVTAWLSLSTHWGLTSVQAALNVIISVLGTAGIWALSRYWWQRGSASILRGDSEVPLRTLLTLSGPGEGWDVVTVLRGGIFTKKHWRLLVQLLVVFAVTLASMLSGPIAKVSLRISRTVRMSELDVLRAIKGDGSTANLLEGNVMWNDTIQSLNQAGFPYNQMLDYLPPSTTDWIYVQRQWDPTWTMTCNYTPETLLHNLTGVGNYTFYDPINAFPVFRDTYDTQWLITSKYRTQVDFSGWSIPADQSAPFRDFLFFVLIQSDPEQDDRMDTNNETLQISLSVLHAHDFQSTDYTNDVDPSGESEWKPFGPVANASYSRLECNITRKLEVPNEDAIPWIWTNDTYSITLSYRNYWMYSLEDMATKNLSISTPTPQDLLRFYQTYFATVNTEYAVSTTQQVSVLMDTVQLSIVFLAMVVILTSLTVWQTGRYLFFQRRYKSELKEVYVPDGKMEWMIHAAKIAHDGDEEIVEGKGLKDRDHFVMANFGYLKRDLEERDVGARRSSLARVYTGKSSIRGAPPIGIGVSQLGDPSGGRHPPATVHDHEKHEHDLKQASSSSVSQDHPVLVISAVDGVSQSSSRDQSPNLEGTKLSLQTSRKSSIDRLQPPLNRGTTSPGSTL
jgi:hypothetical protein